MAELKREMPKLIRDKRIYVGLNDEEFEHFMQMTQRYKVSPSYLGRLAVMLMLLDDARGEFTMQPEFLKGEKMFNA